MLSPLLRPSRSRIRKHRSTFAFFAGLGLCALGLDGSFGCDTARGKEPFSCPTGLVQAGEECIERYSVGVNSVGYAPSQLKRASYTGGTAKFYLRDEDGKRVYTGEATRGGSTPSVPVPGVGGAGGEGGAGTTNTGPTPPSNVYVADFSDFTERGSYYIDVEGGPRSPVFRIDGDVYDVPLEASIMGLYGQRCGVAVRIEWGGSVFRHGQCHLADADLKYSEIDHEEGEIKDGIGGWHDAGDYGKYTVNAAFSAAQMLKAWEQFQSKLEDRHFPIPEEGGDLPDLLDEVRFQLEWLLKMQFPDGQASHKLTAIKFSANSTMPTQHRDTRYFTSASTPATADLVAVLAQGARVFEEYDGDFAEQMLDAASLGLEYLTNHAQHVSAPPTANRGGIFETGEYGDSNSQDERLWAKVEYWETTGDSDLRDEIEESIGNITPRPNWDWQDMSNLAVYTYALSKRDRDPLVVEAVRNNILAQADELVAAANADGYGRALDDYYWGSNGLVARVTMNLAVAYQLDPKPSYLDAVTQQVDHLLGRNPFARSYVTGVGYFPPQSPHHRPSIGDGVVPPWPGHLVGGPNGGPTSWTDDKESYTTNEVAINWTTAMVYALAAAMP